MDAIYTQENREAWQKIADTFRPQFPCNGKTVIVVSGRKYKGLQGVVTWHGINRFYSIQFKTDAMLGLMDMCGREGYSVKVKTSDGKQFFVPAEYVLVIDAAGEPVPSIHFAVDDMKRQIAEAQQPVKSPKKKVNQPKVNLILDLDREREFDHVEPLRKTE